MQKYLKFLNFRLDIVVKDVCGLTGLKIALRQAANAIGNLKDTHLSDFFRRVAFRKGRQAVISATARKLAVIIWTMVTKKVQYSPPTEYLFLDQKRKLKMTTRIKKNIAKFAINPEEIGFCKQMIMKEITLR